MAEEKKALFVLPPPKFKDEVKQSLDNFSRHLNPHFSTPNGMLLPHYKQPPPMYGPRGSTIPPQFMHPRKCSSGPVEPNTGKYRCVLPTPDRYKRYPSRITSRSNDGKELDKEVRPELLILDWKLWCETCDVNCRSEEEFVLHVRDHMPCNVVSCQFVGHPMIMKRHQRQVHDDKKSATRNIKALPSSEEIQQWKEERRKRYPTKQNVMLRQLAQEERFNRGERIDARKARFPFLREQKEKKDLDHNSWLNKRAKRKKKPKKHSITGTVPVTQIKRILFAGTYSLPDYRGASRKHDALRMLGEYGTDDEGTSDESTNRLEFTPAIDTDHGLFRKKQDLKDDFIKYDVTSYARPACDNSIKGHDLIKHQRIHSNNMGEFKMIQEEKLAANEKLSVPKNSVENGVKPNMNQSKLSKSLKRRNVDVRKEHTNLLDYSKLRRSNQNTMLEKLLDSDIRHERNILLQCVRHVTLNKFFGIGQAVIAGEQ